jgi:hypothetical protein
MMMKKFLRINNHHCLPIALSYLKSKNPFQRRNLKTKISKLKRK